MTTRIDRELASMKLRLNAVRMTPSERVEAMAAMRNGFIIVERLVWLRNEVIEIAALFSFKRAAAR
jgi:hypothetical protein